jgi:hypothetical protein
MVSFIAILSIMLNYFADEVGFKRNYKKWLATNILIDWLIGV